MVQIWGRRSVEVTCGGRYGGKKGAWWREKKLKIACFDIRLCYKETILTMIGVCQDSQAWREGGGNMEESL